MSQLQKAVDALARRLRTLGEARLRATLPMYGRTVADVAHALAQRLADVAASAESAGSQPTIRLVPVLDVRAVGDQVAVCGGDAVRALEALPAEHPIITADGASMPASAVSRSALQEVRALLQAVP